MAENAETPNTPETPAPATPQTPPSPGERLLKELQGTQAPAPATPTPPVEPVAAPEVAETPAEPTFLDRLKQAGFENVENEDEAKSRVLEALLQEREKAQASAREAAEIRRLRELEAQQAANPSQPTTAPAPTAEQPARPWQLPQLDQEQLERYQTTTVDPTSGKQVVGWIEGTPPEIKAKYADYERAYKDWTNTLVHKPHEFIAALKEELRQEAVQEFERTQAERSAQQQSEQFITTFKTENAAWLYTTDPLTKQPTDFSAEGKQFNKVLSDLHSAGISDPQKSIALAMQLREADRVKALANRASAADVNEQKKRELLLAGAGNPPSQGGSHPTPTGGPNQRTQNPRLSPGERFLQVTQKDGVAIHP